MKRRDRSRSEPLSRRIRLSAAPMGGGDEFGKRGRMSRRSGIRFADKDMRQHENLPRIPFILDPSVIQYERDARLARRSLRPSRAARWVDAPRRAALNGNVRPLARPG